MNASRGENRPRRGPGLSGLRAKAPGLACAALLIGCAGAGPAESSYDYSGDQALRSSCAPVLGLSFRWYGCQDTGFGSLGMAYRWLGHKRRVGFELEAGLDFVAAFSYVGGDVGPYVAAHAVFQLRKCVIVLGQQWFYDSVAGSVDAYPRIGIWWRLDLQRGYPKSPIELGWGLLFRPRPGLGYISYGIGLPVSSLM